MTELQMKILSQINNSPEETIHFMQWAIEGVTPQDIKKIVDEGYAVLGIGSGFVGGLRTLTLTPAGQEFIREYCDVCECLPCDCGYGS